QNRVTVILGWPQAPFMYAAAALLAVGTLAQIVMTLSALQRARNFRSSKAEATSPIVAGLFLIVGIVLVAAIVVGALYFPDIARWVRGNAGKAVMMGFSAMWIFMLAQVPLAALTGLVGIVGAALFIGFSPALSSFATGATGMLTNSQIATLPLFLMMGSFAA